MPLPALDLGGLVRVRVEKVEVATNLPAQYFPLFEASNRAPVDFAPLSVINRTSNGKGGRERRTRHERPDKVTTKMQAVQALLTSKLQVPVAFNAKACSLIKGQTFEQPRS